MGSLESLESLEFLDSADMDHSENTPYPRETGQIGKNRSECGFCTRDAISIAFRHFGCISPLSVATPRGVSEPSCYVDSMLHARGCNISWENIPWKPLGVPSTSMPRVSNAALANAAYC